MVMLYYPMTKPIKSPDYAAHAHIGSQLTDRKIDTYVARGVYGRKSQEELLQRIESGKYKTLDAEIRKGNVCIEAQAALNRRVVKEPKQPNLPTSAEELLALLDM